MLSAVECMNVPEVDFFVYSEKDIMTIRGGGEMYDVSKKGFTLVELAIVMTIIGLLIGGILKGQELLENARVTSTIAQVKSYDAAVTAFRDIYQGLPGDLKGAGDKICGCNENCTPYPGPDGDGIIGTDYAAYGVGNVTWWGGEGCAIQILVAAAGDQTTEIPLFWMHLLKANLITGISDAGLYQQQDCAFGGTIPAAKIGGGWWVKTIGIPLKTANNPSANTISGLVVLALYSDLAEGDMNGRNPAGQYVLSPGRAEQIDRKMDDGMPVSGTVQAYGIATSCFSEDQAGSDSYHYNGSVASKDCGLVISLQN